MFGTNIKIPNIDLKQEEVGLKLNNLSQRDTKNLYIAIIKAINRTHTEYECHVELTGYCLADIEAIKKAFEQKKYRVYKSKRYKSIMGRMVDYDCLTIDWNTNDIN